MLLTGNHGNYLGAPGLAGLAGKAEVENLQRALTNLSIATQRPAINPGAVTGVMNDATVTAVSSAMGLLTEELPSWLYLALQAAMIAGASTSQAKQYVEQYATQLTIAANTASVKYKVNTPVPTQQPQIVGFFAPGWYKTPFGMLLIGGAAFLIYYFVIKPRQASKA